MLSDKNTEHFVTLFDSNFLPIGMTLHASLMTLAMPFHLWVVCMNPLVEEQLQQLNLPHVTLVPLRELETERLLAVKPGRTVAEYCWTMTSFTPQAVFDRLPDVGQVTYVDADLFFFDRPARLLEEFRQSGKDVLITEHAYAPEYDQTAASGRFCVQFMTFRNTPGGRMVLQWWQDRCIEWCFNRIEEGRFGDQKYLDQWPTLFADAVHILQQTHATLAPWNVEAFAGKGGQLDPVFYHFHGLRITAPDRVRLYHAYRIGRAGLGLYHIYLTALRKNIDILGAKGISVPCLPPPKSIAAFMRDMRDTLRGRLRYAPI